MNSLSNVYKTNLSLLTDFYQFTMAYGFYAAGKAEQEAVFHISFRNNPFSGGYTIAAGLQLVIEYLQNFTFNPEDIKYLQSLTDNQKKPIFSQKFLDKLLKLEFTCSVQAVPEGTIVFPHEPVLQIKGPLLQCQLLETPLLNFINFHSLIATKATRITSVAKGDPVLEFGLRRAQGIDGALSASRAAYIGGCTATSNTLAGKIYNIPVQGTHAHSWVMSFDDEEESFFAFAQIFPDNTIFLVDTYDTLQGVKKAIRVGKTLREQGKDLIGIRLDSGNLTILSKKARKLLDDSGFHTTKIIATNDLNEETISNLKKEDSQIAVWGVGTQLVTSYNQPALGGVYKLSAIKNQTTGHYQHRIKISDHTAKISTPGILRVKRFYDGTKCIGDMIYDELTPVNPNYNMAIMKSQEQFSDLKISKETHSEELLVPIFIEGQCVYKLPALTEIQKRVKKQLSLFNQDIIKHSSSAVYPVGLEQNLQKLKLKLISEKQKDLKVSQL